jgi:hypothetical protein
MRGKRPVRLLKKWRLCHGTDRWLFCTLRFWEKNRKSSKITTPEMSSPPATVPLTIPTKAPDREPEALNDARDAVPALAEVEVEGGLVVSLVCRPVDKESDGPQADTETFEALRGIVGCGVSGGALDSGTIFV